MKSKIYLTFISLCTSATLLLHIDTWVLTLFLPSLYLLNIPQNCKKKRWSQRGLISGYYLVKFGCRVWHPGPWKFLLLVVNDNCIFQTFHLRFADNIMMMFAFPTIEWLLSSETVPANNPFLSRYCHDADPRWWVRLMRLYEGETFCLFLRNFFHIL